MRVVDVDLIRDKAGSESAYAICYALEWAGSVQFSSAWNALNSVMRLTV